MAERPTRSFGLRLRTHEYRALLFFGDLIAGILAAVLAYYSWLGYAWYQLIAAGFSPARAIRFFPSVSIPIWFYTLPLLWTVFLVDLYEPRIVASRRRTLIGIATAAVLGLIVYALVFITYRDPRALPRVLVGLFLLYASLFTLLWRMLYIRLYRLGRKQRRVLVVGAGKAGRTLAQLYRSIAHPPFQMIGFVDDDREKTGQVIEGFPVLGTSERLWEIAEEYDVTELAIAITGPMRGTTFQRILDMQENGLLVTRMPLLYEELSNRVPVHHLETDWLLRSFVEQAQVSGFYELAKRLLDILGGLVGMAVLAVVFPFIALAIVMDSGFPIFYSQPRLGRRGAIFIIRKFRTMYQDAEPDGKPRPAEENDPRVTRVGRFLRRTRLDELPQFWNVLRGEMSLVGPRAERPELVAEYQRQIPFYRARLLVKPGLTGWAQINYGYVASVIETSVKLEYDLYYIKHRSLLLDIQIILRTIGTVVRAMGR